MSTLIFLLGGCTFSEPFNVKRVYRADTRPPSDVFVNGFKAWGTNRNFNAHVLGVSGGRGSRDSAFIPTTINQNVANRFATDLMNVSPDNVSYVYTIRATPNMYEASHTMFTLYSRLNQRVPDITRQTMAEEAEYSAVANIVPEQIQSVSIISRLPNGDISVTSQNNPRFIDDSQTQASDLAYPDLSSTITVTPMLMMGPSGTNINNVLQNPLTGEPSANLPSPSFSLSTTTLSNMLLF
ncbi:hypothetical protein AAW26_06010 [Vibrio alginolyticus]|nr:hypothetical protein AAW26_06010 [Vibrio alginolyticus]